RTVATMRDSKLAMALFRTPGDGAVVVVDGGGSMATALLGDNNAAILKDNGWAGIIINGAVRDAEQLAAIDLGIKALGVCPVRPAKDGIGAVDVPVAFGEVLFVPGHCVYCDRDGVIVSENPIAAG
ncbi:MAG: ribonuclease E activity regulator RraA, partial [bacterium]